MLLIPSRNHADGYRGVCALGRWTLLQHSCGPSIWVPRRGRLVDRWPCRAEPSQVCCWHDRQQSESHGASWIGGQMTKAPPGKPPENQLDSYRHYWLFCGTVDVQGHPPHGVQSHVSLSPTAPGWWELFHIRLVNCITRSQPTCLMET